MSPGCQQVIPSTHHKHRSKKIIWIKIKTNNGKFCFAKLSIFPGHHACCTWDEWNVSILSKNPLVCILLQINQSTITLFPSLLLLNDLVWIFRGFVTWVCFEVFLWQTAPVYNTHIVVFCRGRWGGGWEGVYLQGVLYKRKVAIARLSKIVNY